MTTATKKHEIILFPKQDDFVQCLTSHAGFIGGIGSGKTRAGAVKALKYMGEHAGCLGMITAPTFPMLRDATLRTVFEVFPEGSYTFRQAEMQLTLYNGSEVLFRPTEEPDRLRGPNLAFVYMDEAAQSKAESFKILQGRLRQAGFPHQLWLTTTPKGFNWVYQEFAKEKRADYAVFRVSARDNPYLSPDFVRRLEESYAGEFALQEIEGEFTIVGGSLYFSLDALKAMALDVMRPDVEEGNLAVWKKPAVGGRYIIGADTAWGKTGSYNCAAVFDYQTAEQVAELHGHLAPNDMAYQVWQLHKQYNHAYMGLERAGDGQERDGDSVVVVDKVVQLLMSCDCRDRLFYHDWQAKEPKTPGWRTDGQTRDPMLGEFAEAIRERQLRIHSKTGVEEMMSFVRDEQGTPGHAEGAHDDRVIAYAIGWKMRKYATFTNRQAKAIPGSRQW